MDITSICIDEENDYVIAGSKDKSIVVVNLAKLDPLQKMIMSILRKFNRYDEKIENMKVCQYSN